MELVLIPILAFPVFFASVWLGVTALLGWTSGWFELMKRFPDRTEKAMTELRWQTGSMGIGVNYKNILRLGACRSGLRVGVPKFFSPFTRDFLVPWDKITIQRSKWFWNDVAEFQFGDAGKLTVLAAVADQLKAAAGRSWPEKTQRKTR